MLLRKRTAVLFIAGTIFAYFSTSGSVCAETVDEALSAYYRNSIGKCEEKLDIKQKIIVDNLRWNAFLAKKGNTKALDNLNNIRHELERYIRTEKNSSNIDSKKMIFALENSKKDLVTIVNYRRPVVELYQNGEILRERGILLSAQIHELFEYYLRVKKENTDSNTEKLFLMGMMSTRLWASALEFVRDHPTEFALAVPFAQIKKDNAFIQKELPFYIANYLDAGNYRQRKLSSELIKNLKIIDTSTKKILNDATYSIKALASADSLIKDSDFILLENPCNQYYQGNRKLH